MVEGWVGWVDGVRESSATRPETLDRAFVRAEERFWWATVIASEEAVATFCWAVWRVVSMVVVALVKRPERKETGVVEEVGGGVVWSPSCMNSAKPSGWVEVGAMGEGGVGSSGVGREVVWEGCGG